MQYKWRSVEVSGKVIEKDLRLTRYRCIGVALDIGFELLTKMEIVAGTAQALKNTINKDNPNETKTEWNNGSLRIQLKSGT